jgi:ketosteroid isomerase-like protein
MTTQHDEAAIRQRIDTLLEAIRATDLDGVKPVFAPDLVSFDIEPPLRHLGAAAKWQNWAKVFAAYQSPLGYEVRDLTITIGGDVAFVYSLNRISGTLRNGNRTDMWLRWTGCFRKIDADWFVVHDHVSVPLDMASGKALRDLEP